MSVKNLGTSPILRHVLQLPSATI